MIEPGVRYLAHPPPLQSQPLSLEAAVDLSKKSDSGAHWRPGDEVKVETEDGSDSDTPLDMSVTATRLPLPVFPGFSRPVGEREVSPARSDRSDLLARLPGLYSPGRRDWSPQRSEPDKGL